MTKQECMGYLSVCPLLDTGIPPCTKPWDSMVSFSSFQKWIGLSENLHNVGKPWKARKKAIGNPPNRRFVTSGLPVIHSLWSFFFLFPSRPTGPAQFCWSCATSFGLWPGPLGEGHGLPAVFFGILRSMETCETMFAEWLEQCLNTVSRMILNGQQLGYIMYNVNPGLINHGL